MPDKTAKNNDKELINFIIDMSNPEKAEKYGNVKIIAPSSHENNPVKGSSSPDDITHKITEITTNLFWVIKFWVDPDIYSRMKKNNLEIINRFQLTDFNDKKNFGEIKDIYLQKERKIKIFLNQTSMLMASYIKFENEQEHLCPISLANHHIPSVLNKGLICTGDYPLEDKIKVKEIHKHYATEQFFIQEMILPHHGGDGYCNHIPFDFINKAYAQNGMGNIYGHPGGKVKMLLEKLGIEFINKQN